MTPVGALERLGGCATWSELRTYASERALRRATREGAILRVARGRYVLGSVTDHRRVAHQLAGAVSHLSAALAHGWKVKWVPDRPWVTVHRKRHLSPEQLATARIGWSDLSARERATGLTDPLRTVLDCARVLPFDEALCVADSALRAGDVGARQLSEAAAGLRGPGSAAARAVAAVADARAANPLESVLRAIALAVPGLHLQPQYLVTDTDLYATVDLGDPHERLALEAEGFEAHSSRRDLHRDARRYTSLAIRLWTVLRYSWEDVMLHPRWVRWSIEVFLAERHGLPQPAYPRRDRQAVPA